MADALLPGITNYTGILRYYTVIAWICVNARDLGHRRLLESAFVHATRRHRHVTGEDSVSGVVGSLRVPAGGERFPLRADRRIVSVMDGPFYGPSVAALGLAHGREYTPMAVRLASTVHVPGLALAAQDKDASADQVDSLAPLCLCHAPPEHEREVLQDLLFRLDDRRPGLHDLRRDGPRRRSLAAILHALPWTDGTQLSVLQIYLDWAAGLGSYGPPPQVEEEAYGLGSMALRWFFRHAAETIWSVFGRLIHRDRPNGYAVTPYLETFLEQADGSDTWLPSATLRLRHVVEALRRDRVSESTGHARIEADLEVRPERAGVTAAVQLAALADRVRDLRRDAYYSEFLALGGLTQVSLESFLGQVDWNLTLRDWVRHLLERFALAQHYLTAASKIPRGTNGFFFHPEEEGYRLSAGVWWPDGGPTKIPVALALMRDLRLWTDDGLTELGSQVLTRVLEQPGAREGI